MDLQEPRPIELTARETVLPDVPEEWSGALTEARGADPVERRIATAAVAAEHPAFLAAWADLADLSAGEGDHVAAYAYARVGYHRGLDLLRGAGWRGAGYVRYRHVSNQGFLRSLSALRDAAAAIGEVVEEERCGAFLEELDPEPSERSAGSGP